MSTTQTKTKTTTRCGFIAQERGLSPPRVDQPSHGLDSPLDTHLSHTDGNKCLISISSKKILLSKKSRRGEAQLHFHPLCQISPKGKIKIISRAC